MTISLAGILFIEKLEGFRPTAYRDSGNIWTIGFGTIRYPDGAKVKEGDTCTTEQAQTYLHHDLQWAVDAVSDMVKVPLTQNQFDALTSFVYNVGRTSFATSTLLRDVNNGAFLDAEEQFKRWNLVNGKPVVGLTNRRLLEAEMFHGDPK